MPRRAERASAGCATTWSDGWPAWRASTPPSRRSRRQEPGRAEGPRGQRRAGLGAAPASRRGRRSMTMTGMRTSNGEDIAWSMAAPGSVGSRFQILHAHARGGIGVVSVAFDAELQREVALKQIKTESADDPDSRARFLLEAEVTGRLEHPGIVPVYGLGFDDQGRPYYAMRFVRGITLEEAITKFHAADASRGRGRAGTHPGAAAVARPVRERLPHDGLCPQPGRPAPRPQARERAARPLQRDPDRRLGAGQGAGPQPGAPRAGRRRRRSGQKRRLALRGSSRRWGRAARPRRSPGRRSAPRPS